MLYELSDKQIEVLQHLIVEDYAAMLEDISEALIHPKNEEVKDILRLDVSWNVNPKIDPFAPRFGELTLGDIGIDDLGDALDYIDGVRTRLAALIKG